MTSFGLAGFLLVTHLEFYTLTLLNLAHTALLYIFSLHSVHTCIIRCLALFLEGIIRNA